MKSQSRWQITFVVSLVAASILLYGLHYLLFHDAKYVFSYVVIDLAFIPLEVLFVTMVIHGLLTSREKKIMLRKLNMVISVFFAEVGMELLARLAALDSNSDELKSRLSGMAQWSDKDFAAALSALSGHKAGIQLKAGGLQELKSFLDQQRATTLRLLENPNLLEHESFTDLLWAVSHLTEELWHRPHQLSGLPDSDVAHLAADAERAYMRLVNEWITYLRHLKADYPYLFSLACRTSPLEPHSSPVVV